MNLDVQEVLREKLINVLHMVEDIGAMNQVVKQVPEVIQINVLLMEVAIAVMNLDAQKVQEEKLINVDFMVEVHVVQIVLIGLIPVVVLQNMMDIVQLVSNVFFLMMNVVKLFIYIQKKLW
jgi:hypothetical protein